MIKVSDIMKREIQTVGPATPARMAYDIMLQGGFRHLPVMDMERLIGIISDRDLRLVMRVDLDEVYEFTSENVPDNIAVKDIMTEDPAIAKPDSDIIHVAVLMAKHKIGAMPVLEQGRLVGIITESDMLNLLVGLLK